MGKDIYGGTYRTEGSYLSRLDGWLLEVRPSRHPGQGHMPTYLFDVSGGHYVSNLYETPGGAEFEWQAVRYGIFRTGKGTADIRRLYRYRTSRGSLRRPDRPPAAHGGRQLSMDL